MVAEAVFLPCRAATAIFQPCYHHVGPFLAGWLRRNSWKMAAKAVWDRFQSAASGDHFSAVPPPRGAIFLHCHDHNPQEDKPGRGVVGCGSMGESGGQVSRDRGQSGSPGVKGPVKCPPAPKRFPTPVLRRGGIFEIGGWDTCIESRRTSVQCPSTISGTVLTTLESCTSKPVKSSWMIITCKL